VLILNSKTFISEYGLELIVKSKKSAIIFEVGENQEKGYNFMFSFDSDIFNSLFQYIESESKECWKGLIIKECDSFGSNYNEYYDKELDNNGYLIINENILKIEKPCLESNRLYKFDKKRMQSFLYDFKKILRK
jgi:hypothetical protein